MKPQITGVRTQFSFDGLMRIEIDTTGPSGLSHSHSIEVSPDCERVAVALRTLARLLEDWK